MWFYHLHIELLKNSLKKAIFSPDFHITERLRQLYILHVTALRKTPSRAPKPQRNLARAQYVNMIETIFGLSDHIFIESTPQVARRSVSNINNV